MSLPRYPKYKASGVEWLGEVPEHWEVKPNKTFLTHSQKLVGESWKERQLLSLTLKGVIDRDIHSGHGKYPSDFGTYQEVAVGDLVFCLFDMDETPRTVGLADSDGMITSAYDVFRCRSSASASFVVYYFLHIDSFKGLRPFYTGLRKVVRPPTFMAIKVPMPPIDEQTKIASFLDRETSKIDGLVGEQRRLIELLKEKRQAVISHAVTKGLNPHAPLKPSGIEWLGDVPEHWEIRRIANVFREVAEFGTNELPILSVSIHHGVSDKEFDEEEIDRKVSRSDDRSKYKRVAPDDLVYNMMRAWQGGFGTVKVVGMVSPAYVVARPRRSITTAYVEHLLRTPQAIEQMRRQSRGITDFRLRLYWDEFKNIRIPLPPLSEAIAICDSIKAMDDSFDALTAEAERGIELLQERRTALISAAVTGKIDVRSVV